MRDFLQDLRLAARSLARSRLFAAVAVASLALGIGANTVVFSLVDAVAFRPLPFADADRLVDVSERSAVHLCAGCAVGTSFPGYLDWRERARSYASIGAYREEAVALSGDGAPAERISSALVSASLFPTLRISPAIGRGFTEGEDRVGGAPVALIGHGVWQRRLGGDSGVVGRALRINGVMHTVVGIMPAGFRFPERADVWLPITPAATGSPRDDRSVGVIGRLADGVSAAQADAEIRAIAADVLREHADVQRGWTAGVASYRDDLSGTEGQLFGILLGAVTFVLLIVCANVAGLMLARAAARRREVAVRLALGASRAQVVRQLMAESLLIAAAGGALGALVAAWGIDAVAAGMGDAAPWWLRVRLDGRALAWCAAISALTAIAFGAGPAVRASRADVQHTLKDGAAQTSAGRGRSRLRAALVVGELAMAVVLLAGAGVLVKAFLRIATPPAAGSERLATANLELLDARFEEPAQVALAARRIEESVARVPGIDAAGLSRAMFLAGFGARPQGITLEGGAVPDGASPRFYHAVTPGWFAATGQRLHAGRAIHADDRHGAPGVVVINQALAESLWPGSSAPGRRLRLGEADTLPWLTVVGIVADEPQPAGRRAGPQLFVALAQHAGTGQVSLTARAADDPAPLLRAIASAAAAAEPDVPLTQLRTALAAHRERFSPYRLYAAAMGSFAMVALFLAAMGVYGLVAYSVAQRTREIGLRMAVGADSQRIVGLVLGGAGRLALAGGALGIAASFGLLRLLRSLLFGAEPVDPAVLALVALMLAAVTVIASYLPARRAARLDPVAALRAD